MEIRMNLEKEWAEGKSKHKFLIQYYVYESDGMFIAYCPSLDITSTGFDFNDAVAQFHEHFQLYIEFCLEQNTLIEDLIAHGWKLDGVTISQPSFDELLMKQEFKHLMESSTEYERLNAILKFEACPA
ncbi:MAG: hypothetical protein K2H38_04150 [Muribaculaceae bacterium]|nr:hypothetical protein [Muribaculaceae bacterium]MDE6552433.1 hypothetical protein [Muribaculaceae bacterium]